MKNPRKLLIGKGFTLMELMVAMGIALLIMTMLVGITNVAMGAWQRSRAEVRASRQAKAILDVMAKDFESLVQRNGNSFEWLFAETEQVLPGPESQKSTNAAQLIFFSAAADRYQGGVGSANDKGGDVCAVSYKLAYQDPLSAEDNAESSFVFYRQLVDPKPTFDTFLGKTDLKTQFSSFAGSTNFETKDNASTQDQSMFRFVCENLYQYSISFKLDVPNTASGTTITTPVRVTLGENSNASFVRLYGDRLDTDATIVGDLNMSNEQLKTGKITGVEICLTVLSDSAIEQLKRRKFKDATEKSKFLLQNSYEYSKSVEIPGL